MQRMIWEAFLWLGFFLRYRNSKFYRLHKAEVSWLTQMNMPLGRYWYSGILGRIVALRFRRMSWKSERWLLKLYGELTDQDVFDLTKIQLLHGIGKVRAYENHVVLRTDGYWFSMNHNQHGLLYIHELRGFKIDHDFGEGLPPWKLAYRQCWEVNSTAFVPWLEELELQLAQGEKHGSTADAAEFYDAGKVRTPDPIGRADEGIHPSPN
jgi:hypothetical protein